MRNRLLATAFFSLSLALSGIAFAQTQNSTDAGKRTDPDAASDVRQGQSETNITKAPQATPAPAQQATEPGPQQNSTDAGKRTDPDAASDVQEGEQPH